MPKAADIDLDGTDVSLDTLKELLSVDKELWKEDAKGIREFYNKFGDKLPAKLDEELKALEQRLG